MQIQVQLSQFNKDNFAGNVRNNLASAKPQTVTPQEFVDLVGRNNISYNSCLHIENSKENSNSTANSYQVLSLDFDNKVKIPPNHILPKLTETLGNPNFIYTTKKNPKDKTTLDDAERYRIIYFLEQPILLDEIGKYKRRLLLNYLSNLFPHLDTNAFDEARFFYGGTTVIYENHDTYINADYIYSLTSTFDIEVKTPKAFKKKLKDRRPPKTDKDQKNEEYNNIYINNSVLGRPVKWGIEQWQTAIEQSPLLADFFGAKTKILHPNLYKLYIALMHIEGGVLRWNNAVKANPLIDVNDKINKIHHWIQSNKDEINFTEPPFRSIDPNVSAEFPFYLTQLGKNSKNTVSKIKHIEQVEARDIEDIRADLKIYIKNFFEKGGSFLLKAPTGSSKSTSTIDFLKKNKEYRSGTIIAFPRHNLLQEFGELLKKNKIAYKFILDVPDLSSEILSKEIKSLYKRGFHSSVRQIFRKIGENNQKVIDRYDAHNDVYAIREFLKNNELVCKHNGLILATHQALVYRDFTKVKRVIIDENPLDTLLKVHEIDYSAFKKIVANNLDLNSIYKDVISELDNLEEKENELQFITVPGQIDLKKDRFSDIDFDNLGYLLDADTLFPIFDNGKVIKIVVGQISSLQRYKQLLILSATANYDILSKIIPALELKDLGNVKLKGRFVQFLARGYSKSVVSKLVYEDAFKKFLAELKTNIGNTVIASPSKNELRDLVNVALNYHNSSGLNSLSDYDILAVGTEFPPDYLMPIRAHLLGITFSSTEMDNICLIRYGVEFTLRTYRDLNLREMHIDHMEELLLQTVGRARLPLKHERKAVIIAKIPLQQAEKRLEKDYNDILKIIQSCDVTGSNAPPFQVEKPKETNKYKYVPRKDSDESWIKLFDEFLD
jgi:hypothetical protein